MTSDHLPQKHRRRASVYAIPQTVYLGLEIEYNERTKKVDFAICVHDGSYAVGYDLSSVDIDIEAAKKDTSIIEKKMDFILSYVRDSAAQQNFKINAVGLGVRIRTNHNGETKGKFKGLLADVLILASKIWLELDAVPFIFRTNGKSLDERASSAVRKTVVWMSPQIPGSIPRISVGFRHEVEVDLKGIIKLVDLSHYQKTVIPETWKTLMEITNDLKSRKIKASFFNATPQGGGVALMRHALIRLCNLLNLDIHWFVVKPKPEIFDITKRKFHNVLQGVAPPETRLTQEDKDLFITWSNDNAEKFWSDAEGPLKTSDVIIIDDPQVCGIIPYIKKVNPTCKIIYRSHIEICADLIRDNPNGPQAETWDFLWGFISQCDLFISHPIKNFIPDSVVLLPASTDPLDGLNKDLKLSDMHFYRSIYNRFSIDQCGIEINFNRPYIIQVARFDPRIPLVIQSFSLLRKKLQDAGWYLDEMPSLIICGAGSVDDPDGTPIYEQINTILQTPEYADISDDVSTVRLPPCDQIFNTMLRCSHVALQLSTREGFEVKVTEALGKGIPVVAFKAGGIPLQIEHGETGFLVEIGDVDKVAEYLFTLFTDKQLYERMSLAAKSKLNEQYFTVFQTLNWLYLINQFSARRRLEMGMETERELLTKEFIGNEKWVKDIWSKQYKFIENKSLDNFISHTISNS
ncbi:3562_t:CDS:10 [Diversispora eburnea]|uniref:3562_t:CDS:1 n=1 Tax=Diversispora eburnea TaxID=1213867 RepID=A0A9N9FB04_9GLOM|nr:3562_t:CDS:10 [Diversispora eburnea]